MKYKDERRTKKVMRIWLNVYPWKTCLRQKYVVYQNSLLQGTSISLILLHKLVIKVPNYVFESGTLLV